MHTRIKTILFAVAMLASGFAPAQALAQTQDLKTVALPNDPNEAFAAVGDQATAPMGWLGFCQENPGECQPLAAGPTTVKLTPVVWRMLVAINTRVNRNIEAVTDEDHWGVLERWSYPDDRRGDCEDFALLKRRLLIDAGLSPHALLMTVVRDNLGEGHAVLTVVTDKGDLILDNKRTRILAWGQTGFTFIKRQSSGNPNVWVSIGEPQVTTATAAQ